MFICACPWPFLSVVVVALAERHPARLLHPPADTPQSPSWPPDILTWRTTLIAALTQYLGVFGAAIHMDILHLENDEAWLRIPGKEMQRFGTALSGYIGPLDGRSVGFRTINMGEFLIGLVGRKEEALFLES